MLDVIFYFSFSSCVSSAWCSFCPNSGEYSLAILGGRTGEQRGGVVVAGRIACVGWRVGTATPQALWTPRRRGGLVPHAGRLPRLPGYGPPLPLQTVLPVSPQVSLEAEQRQSCCILAAESCSLTERAYTLVLVLYMEVKVDWSHFPSCLPCFIETPTTRMLIYSSLTAAFVIWDYSVLKLPVFGKVRGDLYMALPNLNTVRRSMYQNTESGDICYLLFHEISHRLTSSDLSFILILK